MIIVNYFKALDKNTDDTLQLAKSCTSTLLNKNTEGKWNALQILEHICMTEKLIYLLLSKSSDKVSETHEIVGNDKIHHLVVAKRGQKVTAPESLIPKGEIKSVEKFERVFLQQRNILKHEIQTGKLPIDNRIHKHPMLGEMTILDWLNFMIHHTQRHLEQIKDDLN